MRDPVDERIVALAGPDLLVHTARCGRTRVFGLTPTGPKTLCPGPHASSLVAAAARMANPTRDLWPCPPGTIRPTVHIDEKPLGQQPQKCLRLHDAVLSDGQWHWPE
jgi:hypothetical protein